MTERVESRVRRGVSVSLWMDVRWVKGRQAGAMEGLTVKAER